MKAAKAATSAARTNHQGKGKIPPKSGGTKGTASAAGYAKQNAAQMKISGRKR